MNDVFSRKIISRQIEIRKMQKRRKFDTDRMENVIVELRRMACRLQSDVPTLHFSSSFKGSTVILSDWNQNAYRDPMLYLHNS